VTLDPFEGNKICEVTVMTDAERAEYFKQEVLRLTDLVSKAAKKLQDLTEEREEYDDRIVDTYDSPNGWCADVHFYDGEGNEVGEWLIREVSGKTSREEAIERACELVFEEYFPDDESEGESEVNEA
jgi:hypothetical protein